MRPVISTLPTRPQAANNNFDATGTRTTFASGLTSPGDIALDGSGNVYVANTAAGTILKYGAAGGTGTIYASGLLMPQAITFGFDRDAVRGRGGQQRQHEFHQRPDLCHPRWRRRENDSGIRSGLSRDADAQPSGEHPLRRVLPRNPGSRLFRRRRHGCQHLFCLDLWQLHERRDHGNAAGNLYIAQPGNSAITMVTPGLTTSTYATVGNEPTGFVYGASVPEPGTLATVLGAAGLLTVSQWRRRQAV